MSDLARSLTKTSGRLFVLGIVTEPHSRRHERPPVEGGGIVGFVFGLLLGALVGFTSSMLFDLAFVYGIAVVLSVGIIVGIIGYFFGDRFWFWFAEKLHWF
jgi:hypothetical protein